jgi:Asp/Glu/hydantoin racemase
MTRRTIMIVTPTTTGAMTAPVVTAARRVAAQGSSVVGATRRWASVAHGSLHLLDTFVTEGRRALQEDGAEAVVLGCAGLTDVVAPLHDALGVPVIEGVAAAVTMVEGLLAQGLTTSRAATFAAPERVRPVAE